MEVCPPSCTSTSYGASISTRSTGVYRNSRHCHRSDRSSRPVFTDPSAHHPRLPLTGQRALLRFERASAISRKPKIPFPTKWALFEANSAGELARPAKLRCFRPGPDRLASSSPLDGESVHSTQKMHLRIPIWISEKPFVYQGSHPQQGVRNSERV